MVIARAITMILPSKVFYVYGFRQKCTSKHFLYNADKYVWMCFCKFCMQSQTYKTLGEVQASFITAGVKWIIIY